MEIQTTVRHRINLTPDEVDTLLSLAGLQLGRAHSNQLRHALRKLGVALDGACVVRRGQGIAWAYVANPERVQALLDGAA